VDLECAVIGTEDASIEEERRELGKADGAVEEEDRYVQVLSASGEMSRVVGGDYICVISQAIIPPDEDERQQNEFKQLCRVGLV
jgi:hypothetical protein